MKSDKAPPVELPILSEKNPATQMYLGSSLDRSESDPRTRKIIVEEAPKKTGQIERDVERD